MDSVPTSAVSAAAVRDDLGESLLRTERREISGDTMLKLMRGILPDSANRHSTSRIKHGGTGILYDFFWAAGGSFPIRLRQAAA